MSSVITSRSFAQIGWWTSSDTLNVFNKNKGAVLIGSYQPLGKLTVGPDDKFYNLSLVGDYNNLAKNYLQIGVTGRGFENLQGQTIFDLYHSNTQFKNAGYNFRINGNSQFFINGEGNIGIGTEKPEAKLDLTGGPNWGGFNKAIHIPINHAVHFDAGTNQFGLVAQNNELNVVLSSGSSTPFGGSFAKLITLLPKKMIIEGDLEVKGRLISQGSTGSNINAGISTSIPVITSSASGFENVLQGLSNNNGNLGLGVSSPVNKLDIAGGLAIGSSYSGNLTAPDNGAIIEGNVGIGTATPDPNYKLNVFGKIKAQELYLTAKKWPDYVFEKDFELRSLTEVEKHIQKYKHLPGIPSEKEIQDGGVAVVDMQAKLLQKIEELTLYIIEQNKRLETQEKKIQALDEKVKRYEK